MRRCSRSKCAPLPHHRRATVGNPSIGPRVDRPFALVRPRCDGAFSIDWTCTVPRRFPVAAMPVVLPTVPIEARRLFPVIHPVTARAVVPAIADEVHIAAVVPVMGVGLEGDDRTVVDDHARRIDRLGLHRGNAAGRHERPPEDDGETKRPTNLRKPTKRNPSMVHVALGASRWLRDASSYGRVRAVQLPAPRP